MAKPWCRCLPGPPTSSGPPGERSASCSGREGAACNVSSGRGGIVRREKSTVTRFLLADWQLSSSSPALRMTQAECLLSSFSLYTRRHVRAKGKVQQVMTHTHTAMLAHRTAVTDSHVNASHGDTPSDDKPGAEEGLFPRSWELGIHP